jgi:dihydrofolate reductase
LGGGEIYREALALANKIYLTLIEQDFSGDTYFPEIDHAVWREVSFEKGTRDEKNPYEYGFSNLERIG